jgi:hypothetical protein
VHVAAAHPSQTAVAQLFLRLNSVLWYAWHFYSAVAAATAVRHTLHWLLLMLPLFSATQGVVSRNAIHSTDETMHGAVPQFRLYTVCTFCLLCCVQGVVSGDASYWQSHWRR